MANPTPEPKPEIKVMTEEEKAAHDAKEAAFGNFSEFMDRYIESKKPTEEPPSKTKRPEGGFLSGIFDFGA
jgi:hypothetical protein